MPPTTPTLLLAVLLLGSARAAPTTFDQRQDGDLNVKVDLDNFVILVAQPSSSSSGGDLFGAVAQLLADSHRQASAQPGSSEAKTAVLEQAQDPVQEAVDKPTGPDDELEKTRELEDVSLEAQRDKLKEQGEVMLVLEGERAARAGVEEVLRSYKPKIGKYKIVESVERPQDLKLVGDAIENCGPGRSRDGQGICQSDGSDFV